MRWKVIAALVAGVVIGAVGGWLAKPHEHVDRYELTHDLDLQQTYFFAPQRQPTVRGVMKAGSQFEIEWRYSRADYVVFRTVVDRERLAAVSRPIAPAQPTSNAKLQTQK